MDPTPDRVAAGLSEIYLRNELDFQDIRIVERALKSLPWQSDVGRKPESIASAPLTDDAGWALEPTTRDRLEEIFGIDLEEIRVHAGPGAEEVTGMMDAAAVASGRDIYLADADLATDLPLMAHEVAHSLAGGTSAHAREVNGPYRGNRPQPETESGGYVIRSSGHRVMRVGEHATFRIEQNQDMLRSTGSRITSRWEVVNDLSSTGRRETSTVAGPSDALEWRLVARLQGVHTIRAFVQLNGTTVATPEYQQEVVSDDRSFVDVRGVTPTTLNTMTDFIALVRRIEAGYPGVPWQDIVSRIRRELYPGPGGTYGAITAAFGWDDLIDEQDRMPGLQYPPVSREDIAALRQHPTVNDGSGHSIDIGHVLTVLDSMNFPGVAGVFAMHDLEGPAAAGWAGDVGSALVDYSHRRVGQGSDAERERSYASLASPEDLLGDIDGAAVSGRLPALPANAPFSQRLDAFYSGNPAQGRNQRWHRFCSASGFGLTGNRLDDASRRRIRDQILRFAEAFDLRGAVLDGLSSGGQEPGFGTSSMPIREAREAEVDWFANRFCRDVDRGLAGESGS